MAEKTEYKPYWELFRDGERIAHGPESTMPDAAKRKMFRDAGHIIKVNGKPFAK